MLNIFDNKKTIGVIKYDDCEIELEINDTRSNALIKLSKDIIRSNVHTLGNTMKEKEELDQATKTLNLVNNMMDVNCDTDIKPEIIMLFLSSWKGLSDGEKELELSIENLKLLKDNKLIIYSQVCLKIIMTILEQQHGILAQEQNTEREIDNFTNGSETKISKGDTKA